MSDFQQIPTKVSQMIVWDPNISSSPYSTRWDTLPSIWDLGVSIWDGGVSSWDSANTETYWVG